MRNKHYIKPEGLRILVFTCLVTKALFFFQLASQVQAGVCSTSWGSSNYIHHSRSASNGDRGINGESLFYCKAACAELAKCTFYSYSHYAKGNWCYLW